MSKYIIKNCIILNGREDMTPIYNKQIVVKDGIIEEITDASVKTDAEYEVVDMGGMYVMPGLINMHVHIPATGKPKKKQSDPKKLVRLIDSCSFSRWIGYKLCEKYVLPELLSGVTTVRTVGGIFDFDARLRDEIQQGTKIGPRIVPSNMAISVPGGHMAGSLAYEVRSAEEARHFAGKIAQSGAELIKLMITGGVLDATKKGEPGEVKMPADFIKAACDEAHRRGLTVAAHVESTEGLRLALANGVDSIEHGAEPDEEIMNLFKERGAYHISTISPALPFALFDRKISNATEEQKFNGNIVFNGIISCAKECLRLGVPVGLGTDTGCPYITHYDMWRELWYFQKYCDVTSTFALYSATLGNARLLGLDSVTGSIEEGKCADLIACKGNPVDDLSSLRDVSMVMTRGKIVDISGLKKFDKVDKELDRFLRFD